MMKLPFVLGGFNHCHYFFSYLFTWLCWVFIVSRGSFLQASRSFNCYPQAQLPCGMWDPGSPTRDRTCILCIARQIPKHWPLGRSASFLWSPCHVPDILPPALPLLPSHPFSSSPEVSPPSCPSARKSFQLIPRVFMIQFISDHLCPQVMLPLTFSLFSISQPLSHTMDA